MEEEVGEIIVTGERPPPVDFHPGLGGGIWVGGGGGGGGGGDIFDFFPPFVSDANSPQEPDPPQEPEPEPEPEEDEGPEIVVMPTPGQEGFADDGDPFNDGASPTWQTVVSWLQRLDAQDIISYFDFGFLSEDETEFLGYYVNSFTGEVTYFISDGDQLYGQVPQGLPPLNDGLIPSGEYQGNGPDAFLF